MNTAPPNSVDETAAGESREEQRSLNFIEQIIEDDLQSGKWDGRVHTRFPPEPNGYLHIGHAKSICLNFGLAEKYNGIYNLRFDDTNPAKEEQEYVDSIKEDVRWLGFDWEDREFFASDYFDQLYDWAIQLIKEGKAYVCDLDGEQIREYRGTLTEPGQDSPSRNRTVEENLELFERMRSGELPDGSHTLRAKIDMSSSNVNLRDPVMYRILHAHHHRTGDKWCIYPMYDYTHCISDALENITHSICTLEFEDHRPLYDWVLGQLAGFGLLARPLPQQYEFARLNLSYVVLSKRKLIQLVEEKHVGGWDDPRMPTLVGARRRGFTPEGFRLFADRIGASKADSWIDMSVLEDCMREDLNQRAPRRMAVLDPVKLVIDNYPHDREELCEAPNHPQQPEWGKRSLPFSRELWIEREDYAETPPKGFFRLFPGNQVRLRYGFVVKCIGADKDAHGNVTAVHCEVFADSKSGTPGADTYKVKGNIHWVSAKHAFKAEVRLYDRLLSVPQPGSERDFLQDLNPRAMQVIHAYCEPSLADASTEQRFQFERHGYYCADRADSRPGNPVFNRTVTLRDSWGKQSS